MFAGTFAPRGWAFCEGQLMAISENDALFSLLGTIYGGDGEFSFALPDLRGRVPIHAGEGPGLTPRRLGERGGAEEVALSVEQAPAHTHQLQCLTAPGDQRTPVANLPAAGATGVTALYGDNTAEAQMSTETIATAGVGQAHENRQPLLAINYIIALAGLFPSRN